MESTRYGHADGGFCAPRYSERVQQVNRYTVSRETFGAWRQCGAQQACAFVPVWLYFFFFFSARIVNVNKTRYHTRYHWTRCCHRCERNRGRRDFLDNVPRTSSRLSRTLLTDPARPRSTAVGQLDREGLTIGPFLTWPCSARVGIERPWEISFDRSAKIMFVALFLKTLRPLTDSIHKHRTSFKRRSYTKTVLERSHWPTKISFVV